MPDGAIAEAKPTGQKSNGKGKKMGSGNALKDIDLTQSSKGPGENTAPTPISSHRFEEYKLDEETRVSDSATPSEDVPAADGADVHVVQVQKKKKKKKAGVAVG